MSGHSKWSQIKRGKGIADAARGKLFTKLGKEIIVAVKAGGADPDTNSKLRDMIAKARSNNMPNDNIMRCIKRASGEDAHKNYEHIMYEGYGAGGAAVLVCALTDNKNRTAGEVRSAFEKNGGSLGVSGSVSFLFDNVGVVRMNTEQFGARDAEETLLEYLIAEEIIDIKREGDDGIIVTCSVSNVSQIVQVLELQGVKVESANAEWLARTTVVVAPEHEAKFEKMLNALDDSDDVQDVYHNAE